MISQDEFNKIEAEHGCGYWNVCWEHACPCAITTENKGLQENIYKSLVKEAEEVAESFKDDDIEIPNYEKCSECGSWEDEDNLIDGMCPTCYYEIQDILED
ncbi:hypothetical protein [Clostridium cagae]|uniref:hypothetical protein n=1 Tax=Clostridium cagae TaxID=2080751 RepID=UPI000CF6E379|nr:hypothetical protein [Clostridium cagae]